MKLITLFDRNCHGHHPTYQKLIAKMLLENGFQVWLICSETGDVKRWLKENVPAKLLRNLVIESVSTMSVGKSRQNQILGIRTWRQAARAIKRLEKIHRTKPDLVFFLKLDDFVKRKGILNGAIIDRLFPYPWAGIYIHFRYPGRLKKHLVNKWLYYPFAFSLSKNLRAIGILQEDMEKKLSSQVASPIVVLPDATDESTPAANPLIEQIKKKAKGKRIIGLIGGQDRRKGSFLFFDIARRCAHKDWLFLFAGKMNYPKSDRELGELQALIGDEKKWENCFFHFERIPDESQFNAVIETCDVLFAAYRNFPFSSNLMTKASLFHKPIVVSTGHLMETRVRKYGTGFSCSPEDTDDCIRAIGTALSHPNPAENYNSYAQEHSSARFLARLQFLIESAVT